MKRLILCGVAVFYLLIVTGASAFTTGDIFASINSGLVAHYLADGTFVGNLNTTEGGYTTGMAFDPTGNLYVTNFSVHSVSKFDPSGVLLGNFGSGYSTPESIVRDAAGNFYVGNLGNGIRKFDATGAFLGTVINTRVDWMDLASDQLTMVYTQEGFDIKTVNVNTGVPGANFTTGTATKAYALRILSDGGVLLADYYNVKRYNAGGVWVQTYDMPGEDTWFALNLNPDGNSFWSGNFGTGVLYEFDIASGANTQFINTGVGAGNLFGVATFGEPTQGTVVPEPATMLLLGSGLLGMGGISAFRFRRKK